MTHTACHIPDPVRQPEFYADVPTKRLIAWVVDVVIIVVFSVLLLPFTAFTGLFFFPMLYLGVSFLYRCITIARGSATWGMRLTAIELRTVGGDRLDLPLAVLHTLGYSLSWATFLLQGASVVLMLTSSRAQGLTDHMMGTVAINRRARC